jgi:hypothetical protein
MKKGYFPVEGAEPPHPLPHLPPKMVVPQSSSNIQTFTPIPSVIMSFVLPTTLRSIARTSSRIGGAARLSASAPALSKKAISSTALRFMGESNKDASSPEYEKLRSAQVRLFLPPPSSLSSVRVWGGGRRGES